MSAGTTTGTIEYVANTTHGRYGVHRRPDARHPTYAEAEALLIEAEATKSATAVYWRLTLNGTALNDIAICRCSCGEIVIRDSVCQTCRLIASLVLDVHERGPQVQYERCERAVDRLARRAVELQAKAKGAV